ncbi:MAG: carbohydrate ABC transporter permease [Clostridia bacterium]|nr:carbohydrate ABC transporter permease [Clostridia bacterium]
MKHKSFRQMGINTLIRLLLLLFALIVLYPMFWNIVSSFKTSTEFLGDPFALPGRLEWDNYARALEKSNLLLNFKNTFIVEIAALLTMAVTVIPSAYCLSRFRFFGSKTLNGLYMSMIFIQTPCIMIPMFLAMNRLHLVNKLVPLGVLYAVGATPFSIFLLSGFMKSIPRDFEDAAMIDGAGWGRILVQIIVPMAKPGVVTVMMLAAMNNLSEYIVALVMLSDPSKYTVPVGITAMYEMQRYATDWGALFAALVMVLVPTAAIYAVGQRYLMQGVCVGGVKG